jgi:hypothetical protein
MARHSLTKTEMETIIVIPNDKTQPVWISTDSGASKGWLRKLANVTETDEGVFNVPQSMVRSYRFLFPAKHRPGFVSRAIGEV